MTTEILLTFVCLLGILLTAVYTPTFKGKKPEPIPADKFPQQTDYPVEPYFTVGGKTFYQFVDPNNLPAGRSLAALKYFIQLKTNCDEKFLRYFHQAMDGVLKDKEKIDLEKMFELKNILGDRLTWAFHPSIILRYASVLYMAEGENPYTYDDTFNDRKIEFWKQNATAESFFLASPFTRLIPYSKDAVGYVPKYSEVVVEADLIHHKKVLQLLSSMTKSNGDVSSLSSQITALEMLRDYVANRQMNTSSLSTSGIQLLKK